MSNQKRVSSPIYALFPTEFDGFDSLADLALDMRWSWNHSANEVWKQIDSRLWELTQNPWVVLQTVSREQLHRVLADPAFHKKVDDLVHHRRYKTRQEAIQEITEYIEIFYTRQRRQAKLGFLSPVACEQQFYNRQLAA